MFFLIIFYFLFSKNIREEGTQVLLESKESGGGGGRGAGGRVER
jgi:hypothetical protein